MQYRFIDDHHRRFTMNELCECFGLSRSGYYDWLYREPSARSIEDATFKERITGCTSGLVAATVTVRFTTTFWTRRLTVVVTARFG